MFYDILERKNVFLWCKNQELKQAKNWVFSKGVSPCIWSKIGHFSILFFLGSLGPENVFHDVLERKNAFLCYKNKELKKSKNWDFCKGVSPWSWSKLAIFSIFFFLGSLGQENVFYDILQQKNAWKAMKTKSWKSRKIGFFPKGLVHVFGPKLAIFPSCFFWEV